MKSLEARRPPHVSPMLPLGAALGALAEGFADGVLAVDGGGLVLAHNRRFHSLWGLEAVVPLGSSSSVVGAALAERLLDGERPRGAWLSASAGFEREELFRLKGGRVLEGRLAAGASVGATPLRVWSFRDVTARERAREEALDDQRRARAELTDRERMLCVAAHELRSPLASMRIAVEALLRKTVEGPRQARLLEVIERDERRLTKMIGELLDLGRIRSDQLSLELEPVDLAELVHDVVGRMVPEIARSGSQLTVHAGAARVVGCWDRSRLEQVATNLIGNAAKYGGGRPIEVEVELESTPGAPGVARLTVSDHGRGIDPRVQRQIFEPFARAPGVRDESGLGLGLYIVQSIVRLMGGQVGVESSLGAGATFTVHLPLGPAMPPNP